MLSAKWTLRVALEKLLLSYLVACILAPFIFPCVAMVPAQLPKKQTLSKERDDLSQFDIH